MKKIDTDADLDLDPAMKEIVWVDTVGWDDADLHGKDLFPVSSLICRAVYSFLTLHIHIQKLK